MLLSSIPVISYGYSSSSRSDQSVPDEEIPDPILLYQRSTSFHECSHSRIYIEK